MQASCPPPANTHCLALGNLFLHSSLPSAPKNKLLTEQPLSASCPSCILELRSSSHLSTNMHIEQPRDLSCQPERRPSPPREEIHRNMSQRLRKQAEENSSSIDFHRLLNNSAATSSCSSTRESPSPVTWWSRHCPCCSATTTDNSSKPVCAHSGTAEPSFCCKDAKSYSRRSNHHPQSQQMQNSV